MKPQVFLTKIEKLENEKERINEAIHDLLIKRGWEQTDNTPGEYMLWKTELDHETVLVDSRYAVLLEKAICKSSVKNEQ